jgi:predicted permease
MRIPLLAGRDLDWRDRENMPRVALVNEAFAEKFYGRRNPVGEFFQLNCSNDDRGVTTQITGVTGNVKYFSLRAAARPAVYLPYRQSSERWMTFAVRTPGNPVALLPAIRRILAGFDPNLPIYDAGTQREWIDRNVAEEQRLAVLLVVLGVVALLMACSGIYGTLAYLVHRRTPEIGIRMALGARRREVVRLIVRESMIPVAIGIVLGIAGALMLTRFVSSMLFGVQASDAPSLIAATLFLLFTAGLAALLPARRASRIEPMSALRCE